MKGMSQGSAFAVSGEEFKPEAYVPRSRRPFQTDDPRLKPIADKVLAGETWTEPHYQRQAQRYVAHAVRALRLAGSPVSLAALVRLMRPGQLDALARQLDPDAAQSLHIYIDSLTPEQHRGLAGTREIFDIELDAEYETWSRVNQFTVETRHLHALLLGSDTALGQIKVAKAWRDTLAVKLGGDVSVIPDRLALRAGAFYETAVADPAHANVDFAGGPMLGGSVGGSVVFGRWEVALAYQLRHQSTVSVSEANARVYQQVPASACMPPYQDTTACNEHYLGQPAPAVNAGTYNATSHYLALALLFRPGF